MLNTYIEENKERFLQELIDLLKIPSISADSNYKDDVLKMAQELSKRMEEAGAENIEIIPTGGHPLVYGDKIIDPSLPTVLVYGHYDVQPPDPVELWDSGPFEPVIKKTDVHPEGAIFARGACDDKGQMYMQVKAFEAMNKTGNLPCNVKFIIEGEEEVGSENLEDIIKKYADKFSADVILVSDTGILSNETPSITTGLRGLSYVEVEVVGPNRDLHSGLYGGAVPNPLNVLSSMIASLKDEHGRITIPGFYDDVEEVSQEERDLMANAPFSKADYLKEIGLTSSMGEEGYTILEQTSVRPTLDVNGMWGGYTGEGAKTVIPSKANAKISMRLVPNQDYEKISDLFQKHFESIAPEGVKVKVTPHHGGEPAVTPVDSIEYKAASNAMEETFGKVPVPLRSGGSIPIVAMFERVLGIKTVLFGFGLGSDAIHSPNEHYGLFNFYKGIETIPLFFRNYAELKK
ncbi:dipeptidase [Paracrocinitomix mangrovi]|uniref:dipeptidase n=1 Tax=Paracrocinitomix mangrovi TaxID=2862509 RepID=UPI001C8CFDFE|nr:dipeptidase [Paracrocinitomix mangrovi]UKN03522.1 dipeptidase [Paracrocinitomix mangrovi]